MVCGKPSRFDWWPSHILKEPELIRHELNEIKAMTNWSASRFCKSWRCLKRMNIMVPLNQAMLKTYKTLQCLTSSFENVWVFQCFHFTFNLKSRFPYWPKMLGYMKLRTCTYNTYIYIYSLCMYLSINICVYIYTPPYRPTIPRPYFFRWFFVSPQGTMSSTVSAPCANASSTWYSSITKSFPTRRIFTRPTKVVVLKSAKKRKKLTCKKYKVNKK